jgi:hypothetical protein
MVSPFGDAMLHAAPQSMAKAAPETSPAESRTAVPITVDSFIAFSCRFPASNQGTAKMKIALMRGASFGPQQG